MIYIMTPHYPDFMRKCRDLKINPRDPIVVFVYSWEIFLGRRIYPEDKIIEGDDFHVFKPNSQMQLLQEIAIRSRE